MGHTETRIRYPLALLLGASLALTACGGKEGPGAAPMQMPPPAVEVVTVKTQPLELNESLPARVTAFRTAEIRPQVSGIVTKRFFEEGAQVKEGDKLYQIDSALYEAALASAKAQLAVAQANAHSASLRAKRYSELAGSSAISQQELDDSEATAKQSEAQVQAAKAAVKTAEVNLGYTVIRAPISGVISRSTITEGSLVSAQQATALTTIRQLSPVYVDIQRPASSFMRMQNPSVSREVTVELDDGTSLTEKGLLQFTDVSVDTGTGNVNVRALFDNQDSALLPGMFVRAKVPSEHLDSAILVPQRAVARQANATSVLVVNPDNVVEMRFVEVTRAVGDQWLLKSGLNDGERIIVSGLQKVQPGIPVTPQDVTDKTKPAQKP